MMKFDPTSIYNRAVDKLQQDPNWKPVINNSVISSLIKSNAEINSETARYAEYLFKESKWNTAQNTSSILAMANMLGYQPKRSISASGQLYVSVDPRTHLVGKTISLESFEKLSEVNNSLSWVKNPYGTLYITPSSIIQDSEGNSYIADNYYTLGTEYYTTIGILQGALKSVFIDIDTIRSTYTTSKLYPYLYIPFKISNCENASTLESRRFFKLYVAVNNDSESTEDMVDYTEYRIVDNLLLSSSEDLDVEVYNDLYNQDLFYAKFNNDIYKGNVLDVSSNSSLAGIRIDYLESSGSSGNQLNRLENFTITNTIKDTDDGKDYSGIKLYGINKYAISGGKDPEGTSDIKTNATKFYISNYSVGTKESYEKTVLNTDFKVTVNKIGVEIKPKKVKVYGGLYTNSASSKEVKQPVTYISFISDNLEDIATSSSNESQYSDIEDSLNYYLGRLKSPQDVIKFQPPKYVPIALGLNCTVSNDNASTSTTTIESSVRDLINEYWGPNSDYIDFGNSFSKSALNSLIMKNIPDVVSIDTDVEAIQKLMWSKATKVHTNYGTTSSVAVQTCRLPFSFSPVFIGNSSNPGFKDHRTGNNYIIRFDFMYKKPTTLTTNTLNKTIFVAESSDRLTTGFYTYHDQDHYWDKYVLPGVTPPPAYIDMQDSDFIDSGNCYQVNLVNKVYTDSDFSSLLTKISDGEESTKNSNDDPGAIDNYLIYFSGNYDKEATEIGDGWFEIGFDAIYNLLEAFSVYDSTLTDKLTSCPLNILKCDTSDTECFKKFIDMVSTYLDIYVSLRPIDDNLRLVTSSLTKEVLVQNNRSVLYIDSYDSINSTKSYLDNLTSIKKNRMIAVQCDYEES